MKKKVHYLIPGTTRSYCGIEPYINGFWENVTCLKCKKKAKQVHKSLRKELKLIANACSVV